MSSQANWRYSLDWLQRDRHLFTPRALSGFVMHQIAAEASEQGEWRAFHLLLLEALRYGKNTPRDYAIFLAIWLLPRRRRRRLRDWMARRPALRSLVVRGWVRYENSSAYPAISACPGRHGERGRRAERCPATKRAYGAGGDPSPGVFERCVGAGEVARSWTFRPTYAAFWAAPLSGGAGLVRRGPRLRPGAHPCHRFFRGLSKLAAPAAWRPAGGQYAWRLFPYAVGNTLETGVLQDRNPQVAGRGEGGGLCEPARSRDVLEDCPAAAHSGD